MVELINRKTVEKRLRYFLSLLSVLLLVAVAAMAWAWWRVRASLPQLDGEQPLPGLSATVTVQRDAAGVPTITGATRRDVARATGFVHAQDRFFQMDLLRRSGAGELAELFGPDALPIDRAHRLHGFRAVAAKAFAGLPEEHRALLTDYAAGVNAALQATARTPWEYVVLRTAPVPWRPEDSLLVGYAMWFDLQDSEAQYEQSVRALRLALGLAGVEFFAPSGSSWDSAIDGSTFPTPRLPPWQLKAGGAAPATTAALTEARPLAGSNAFAVRGAQAAAGGAALLANDMHLSLNVPHIWYRAVLQWTEAGGTARRVAGVMLPGAPAVVAGSNGQIAWGFTNAGVDSVDVVLVETETLSNSLYRTPHGWVEIEERKELLKVAGKDPVPYTVRWTEWGPIIGGPEEGRFRAVRWTAHDAAATNLNILQLESVATAADALTLAPGLGLPNQNLLVADTSGAIGWTVTGLIPRRIGFDGRQSVSWAFGDRKWDGWVPADEIPSVLLPGGDTPAVAPHLPAAALETLMTRGVLWSANQRMVGGDALARLGDNGYDEGARGAQLRDRLQQLATGDHRITPADLLALQLDDRALYLERWQKVLLATLTDDAVAGHRGRRELRDAVKGWTGRASVDSVAYRAVQSFHRTLATRALAPFFAKARDVYPDFSPAQLHSDDALWRLIQEKPDRLLNPEHHTWDELMLAAVDDVLVEVDQLGAPMDRFTWGARNTLRMQHPFASFLPRALAGLLSMPATPLPGDNDMPRVQGSAFGASERMVVAPGHEAEGILHLPGGQSGNPLSPFFRAGHDAWVKGEPTPFLPGPVKYTLVLKP